ncbi:hypothetical protein [Tychonema sp. LEGE 07196]|uniref:hypothetical protein n=1 Tax=Tychonema sp. LEGE 07196 TaxID=1828665 RepID=UPI0030D9E52B
MQPAIGKIDDRPLRMRAHSIANFIRYSDWVRSNNRNKKGSIVRTLVRKNHD